MKKAVIAAIAQRIAPAKLLGEPRYFAADKEWRCLVACDLGLLLMAFSVIVTEEGNP